MDKTISYLESRVWYRALKVLYIIFFCLIFLYWLGLWATEGNFEYPLIFLIGLALIALLFFIVKKVFYYIVLGAPLVPLPASESMKRMIFASKSEQLAPENKPTKRFYGKYSLWFLVFAVVLVIVGVFNRFSTHSSNCRNGETSVCDSISTSGFIINPHLHNVNKLLVR